MRKSTVTQKEVLEVLSNISTQVNIIEKKMIKKLNKLEANVKLSKKHLANSSFPIF